MTWWRFARLIRAIFGPRLPDLERIQDDGLLAVKIAQTFALRIDFLDRAKCEHLAQLYRGARAVPAEAVEALLAAATDDAWRARFASIDPQPLAAASVGQVHRARLADGDEVAVKLIKQDFARRFAADADSVRRLFRLATFLYPKLARVADPVGMLANLREYTLSELDLRNEVAHADVLRGIRDAHAGVFDLAHLRFPEVHRDLSGERVLVSEYIPGPTLDELLARGELPYEKLLELFHLHGFFMFCVGTFHGDIHPGNVLLRDDDLYFVDTGALSHVCDRLRRGLFGFFAALSQWDYPTCAQRLNEMAERPIDGAAFERFRVKFLDLYRDFTHSSVAQVSLTRKMMETIKLGVHSGMVFERGMFPIIKSLMYLDGMVLRCRPEAVLLEDMRVFIDEFGALV